MLVEVEVEVRAEVMVVMDLMVVLEVMDPMLLQISVEAEVVLLIYFMTMLVQPILGEMDHPVISK
jgi:hypothetical protein